jgi:hypothetical protein
MFLDRHGSHTKAGDNLVVSLRLPFWSAFFVVMAHGIPALTAQWTLVEENDDTAEGYVIFKRSVSGSEVIEFKITGLVDAPVERVANAAWTSATDPKYVQDDQRRKIIDGDGKTRCHVYLFYEMPALISDRDVTQELAKEHNAGLNTYRIVWRTANDKGPPPIDGVIRMPVSNAAWELASTQGGQTIATYTNRSDPGGSIPSWIVNTMAKRFVVGELDNLRKLVQKQP